MITVSRVAGIGPSLFEVAQQPNGTRYVMFLCAAICPCLDTAEPPKVTPQPEVSPTATYKGDAMLTTQALHCSYGMMPADGESMSEQVAAIPEFRQGDRSNFVDIRVRDGLLIVEISGAPDTASILRGLKAGYEAGWIRTHMSTLMDVSGFHGRRRSASCSRAACTGFSPTGARRWSGCRHRRRRATDSRLILKAFR